MALVDRRIRGGEYHASLTKVLARARAKIRLEIGMTPACIGFSKTHDIDLVGTHTRHEVMVICAARGMSETFHILEKQACAFGCFLENDVAVCVFRKGIDGGCSQLSPGTYGWEVENGRHQECWCSRVGTAIAILMET